MPYVRKPSVLRPFRRGMGADPSSPCYDSSRPSWMPYWMNTSNEQACLQSGERSVSVLAALKQLVSPSYIPPVTYGSNVQAATTIGLPQDYNPETGTIGPANVTGATVPSPPYGPAVVADLPTPPPDKPTCDPTMVSWSDPTTWCLQQWLIAGGIGVAGVLMFTTAIGGRR